MEQIKAMEKNTAFGEEMTAQSADTKSKELTPKELEHISGGAGKHCWFRARSSGSEFKYGANRKECAESCHAPYGDCGCYGTDNCVERWHKY